MTAIRVLEVSRDAELSRLAREILDSDLRGNASARVHVYDENAVASTGRTLSLVADAGASIPDVILATCRDAEDARSLAGSVAEEHGPTPVVIFTTVQAKAELLAVGEFSALDVVSEEESRRLPLSVKHAANLSELRRREGKLEDELSQAKGLLLRNQKSITVGRLLGSIAHEINNPLEAVTNLLYLAQRQSADQNTNDCIAMAERELQRVGEITRQMLSFHRESRTVEEIQVTGAVETGLALFETRLRQAGIVVERQFRSVGRLTAYAGELRQVFSNLFANSVDAMPKGGRLIVRVQERLGVRPTLCITIADTGVGMSRDVVQRVGDLFFTTKGETGTGLGMWVTRQLIEKHGGKMRVYSATASGRSGTVFRLEFTEPHARFKGAVEAQAEELPRWSQSAGRLPGEDESEDLGPAIMSA